MAALTPSTNSVLSGAGLHHIALRAREFDRSLAFYEKLGFTVAHQWGEGCGRIALLDVGDGNFLELFASGSGQSPDPEGDIPPPWPFFHLALRSEDVDADIAFVRSLGCEITVEPKSVDVNGKTIRVGFFLGPARRSPGILPAPRRAG